MERKKSVIFWGAGATAPLGFRTTDDQARFIDHLVAQNDSTPLEIRINNALAKVTDRKWHKALRQLVNILGDDANADKSIYPISHSQAQDMRENWNPAAATKEQNENQIRARIIDLRVIYDWPALKSAVRICPGRNSKNFKINDLFNVLDLHTQSGHGFRNDESQILTARRLQGARNALVLMLNTMIYIDYQESLANKRDILKQYYDFSILLGKRMQKQGIALFQKMDKNNKAFDKPEFYCGDVSFVSLNYDPIGLWTQFVANRDLNRSLSVPHVDNPAVPLQIYHDMGHFIPARRVKRDQGYTPWYPMNEASAQRLNDPDHPSGQRIRTSKFLFPHGCLCWRECPDCGKLSAYHGNEWSWSSASVIPPPPLKAFVKDDQFEPVPDVKGITNKEKEAWKRGRIDARTCLHCHTLTSAHNTRAIMQSSFKERPPSFIEEIQRDLRVTVMKADHIILMGYSLPLDDVTYRAFFAARRQRAENNKANNVRCTVVGFDTKYPNWYGPMELDDKKFLSQDFLSRDAVLASRDIFGRENVRYYGGGVPNVFLDSSGNVSESMLDCLLDWSEK